MAIVRLCVRGGLTRDSEEREMDRVPNKGEIVCVGSNNDFLVVEDVYWRTDGHASVYLVYEGN